MQPWFWTYMVINAAVQLIFQTSWSYIHVDWGIAETIETIIWSINFVFCCGAKLYFFYREKKYAIAEADFTEHSIE